MQGVLQSCPWLRLPEGSGLVRADGGAQRFSSGLQVTTNRRIFEEMAGQWRALAAGQVLTEAAHQLFLHVPCFFSGLER